MGNLIFGTTTVQGRTFDDIKIQTSKAGVPRPIVFGRARPIVGNIIATTSPRIVAVREEQDGGKGGPSVEVENEEVYRTYAIRICEGPVTGIRRVWRNNELVYDRDSTDPTQLENNSAFLEKAEFFLGGYDQMPSSVMQSAFGMDNVHAYRGTCYMVVDDENLTATGGAIPQYAFEVERAEGFVLTSRPYSVESADAAMSLFSGVDSVAVFIESAASAGLAIAGGSLRDPLIQYGNWPPEAVEPSPSITGGSLVIDAPPEPVEYQHWPPESVESSASIVGGSLLNALLTYENYSPEAVESNGVAITGGSLA